MSWGIVFPFKSLMDPLVGRILDANANRAREALRVLEDFARFVLDDRLLTSVVKQLRHETSAALDANSLRGVIRARAVEGDVGRDVETEREYRRDGVEDVALAAGKRASEALRSLEENVKTIDPAHARTIERLRYRLYEVERAVAIRLHARNRFAGIRLYVLITESLCRGDWLVAARRAIEGGADCLQLREESLSDRELLKRARSLVTLCRKAGVLCLINDRPDIARLSGADGVHVGRDDLAVADARRIIGTSMLVGVSTHTLDQVREAAAASPDYIAVGPMFATGTKPDTAIAGPGLLREALAETSLPVVAIGGINEETVPAVAQAGASTVSVCSAVISRDDVAAAARGLKSRLQSRAKPASARERIPPGA